MNSSTALLRPLLWLLAALGPVSLACEDSKSSEAERRGGAGETANGAAGYPLNPDSGGAGSGGAGTANAGMGGVPASATKFAVSSVVFSPEGETTYLSILDSLEPQVIDYTRALELSGWADMWVHAGYAYVSSGDSPTVTRYTVAADGGLQEDGVISFANYGEVDVAFWSNTFVAADKAYMINGTGGYVIWDPLAMEVRGTLELPELPQRPGFILRAGTLDRSNVIRDGKLYQPMYWSDEDYARFTPDSRVVVIDIATDTVEATLEAPCAGLDVGTRDDAGNTYFSTWTSGVYSPLSLGSAGNCVASIAAGEAKVEEAFTFAGIADGREGAAVRHLAEGKLLVSIFHHERADLAAADDPWAVLGGANWRTWSFDPLTEEAEVVDSIDWNSGATYVFEADGRQHIMVPAIDYGSTSVMGLNRDLTVTAGFELRGWGIRLFQIR